MNIKKQDLEQIYQFLDQLTFKGAASRPVTKLKHAIQAVLSELLEDEIKLVEENNGEIGTAGKVTFPDAESQFVFTKAQQALRQELSIFEETTQGQFQRLYDSLMTYDKELSGQDADAYELLLEGLEETEKNNEN